MDGTEVRELLRPIAGSHPALQLLVLHGSRARLDHHEGSDWDLAYLADGDVDHLALLDDVTSRLQTDAVDLVDLSRASALLRFGVARDGVVVHEREVGAFLDFQVAAAIYWCDIEPVVRRAHAAVLAGLG